MQIRSKVTLGFAACGTTGCPPPYSYGDVTSHVNGCLVNRKVTVREVGGSTVGSDTTNRKGHYRVDALPTSGTDTVAVAAKKPLSNNRICEREVSQPEQFSPPP
jgi:hypothetical protein